LSEGVRCGLDKEIAPDRTYLAYFLFGAMIERSQMTPYHKKLKEVAGVNVERPITILTLDEWVAAELADRKAILEGYDEVLVHNEAKTTTYGDMWAVRV
jgi:hypothetical protein